ncbi:MAG: DUF3488 and transglutaminase-like domain-containing protein [Campylobacterota bacterium]|nr:DUF3488 and transglutaminase-like domain-containing protein [Campylobacterota bacterium]
MKFLQSLLHTKAPSNDRLLDIAIILSIIPHLFVAKFFMLLYIAIALFFILKNISKEFLLMALGLILIGLSFFSSYNFSDFSRMQFFVSLVSSLLIFALTLQKLTKVTNVYLKITPVLLMVLSFFFYNSIIMLAYSISTLFIFTLLYVWSKMDAELLDVLKFTSRLFVLSLPLVTLLFLVFPRISIEKTDFGFRADKYVDSGYDGTMSVSSNAIKLSNKIVMEVLFKDKNISDSQLYFRGSTLTKQEGLEWLKESPLKSKERLLNVKNTKEYEVTIYPHAKNWVYALDMPLSTPNKTELNSDYTLSANKPLYEKKKFLIKSALSYRLYTNELSNTLLVDKEKNDKTYEALRYIREKNISQKEKALKLLTFFRSLNLSYTLKPKGTDLEDFTDSFLLKSKNGYCVHFASAFASSARMLGIPSRVVTGFKADKKNMINSYLLVKSSDAHAWVELYFKEDGWVRFEPTATAKRDLTPLESQTDNTLLKSGYFTKINHYYLYTKYMINNWVLDYNRAKQMAILNKILNDTLYLLKFIFSFLLLIFFSFLLKSRKSESKLTREMKKLLKLLKKHDIVKKQNESMQSFLMQAEDKLDTDFKELSRLYHLLKYKKAFNETLFIKYKEEIKRVKEKL